MSNITITKRFKKGFRVVVEHVEAAKNAELEKASDLEGEPAEAGAPKLGVDTSIPEVIIVPKPEDDAPVQPTFISSVPPRVENPVAEVPADEDEPAEADPEVK